MAQARDKSLCSYWVGALRSSRGVVPVSHQRVMRGLEAVNESNGLACFMRLREDRYGP